MGRPTLHPGAPTGERLQKIALSTPFQCVLPPSGLRILAESGRATHFLAPGKGGSPLSTPPRPTPHDARPAGSGRAQTLPRWPLPDTDSQILHELPRPQRRPRIAGSVLERTARA